MHPLRLFKDIQKLIGKIAALSQFISKSINKCLPFIKMLRDASKFAWDEHFQKAFNDLKKCINSPSMLVSVELGKTLFLYLVASDKTLVAILVRETPSGQSLIDYVSQVL